MKILMRTIENFTKMGIGNENKNHHTENGLQIVIMLHLLKTEIKSFGKLQELLQVGMK